MCCLVPQSCWGELVDLVGGAFQGDSFCVACGGKNAFSASGAVAGCGLWSCRRVCGALAFLLDNIYIRFGSELYGRIVGISVGAVCSPLDAGLFFFCCADDFVLFLSEDDQSGVIEAFSCTSRYLDDLLGIDSGFFGSVVGRVCPLGLRLYGVNVSDTEASVFGFKFIYIG